VKRVRWSAHAKADLDSKTAYRATTSVRAAEMLFEAIHDAIEGLKFVNTGRLGRIDGTFEKVLRKQPYIILYETNDDEVHVMRIVHTAQNWPEGAWPPRD
jgi:plasmid stabilization system protein ParE